MSQNRRLNVFSCTWKSEPNEFIKVSLKATENAFVRLSDFDDWSAAPPQRQALARQASKTRGAGGRMTLTSRHRVFSLGGFSLAVFSTVTSAWKQRLPLGVVTSGGKQSPCLGSCFLEQGSKYSEAAAKRSTEGPDILTRRPE